MCHPLLVGGPHHGKIQVGAIEVLRSLSCRSSAPGATIQRQIGLTPGHRQIDTGQQASVQKCTVQLTL